MAHWSRLSQGIVFHCKIIIYTTFVFRGAPQGASLAYDTTHDTSYTHIFANTLHTMTGPPCHTHKYRVNFQIWHKVLKTCYVAEFETYVPYVYIGRAQHEI